MLPCGTASAANAKLADIDAELLAVGHGEFLARRVFIPNYPDVDVVWKDKYDDLVVEREDSGPLSFATHELALSDIANERVAVYPNRILRSLVDNSDEVSLDVVGEQAARDNEHAVTAVENPIFRAFWHGLESPNRKGELLIVDPVTDLPAGIDSVRI